MYYDIAVSLAILQTIHIITAVPWSTPYSTIRGVVNMPMVGVDDSSLQANSQPGLYLECTLCPKKTSPFYFSNNSVKNYPILMIFGVCNPEKIWHR